MKKLGFYSLLALSILTAAPAAASSVRVYVTPTYSYRNVTATTPFDLVYLGYRGYFRGCGVPSYSAFVTAVKYQRLSAAHIVKCGVASKKLPPHALNDSRYINAVHWQMQRYLYRSH